MVVIRLSLGRDLPPGTGFIDSSLLLRYALPGGPYHHLCRIRRHGKTKWRWALSPANPSIPNSPARFTALARLAYSMSRHNTDCCRTAFKRVIATTALLLSSATWAASQTLASAGAVPAVPMALLQTRYELRIGESASILAPQDILNFLAQAKTRQLAVAGQGAAGLVVAPNQTQDGVLLAPTSKATPGEYTVTLSATAATGEQRQTTLDVVVQPRASLPAGTTRVPLVLLNCWQTRFTNSCPLATTPATTFGNPAQYLVSDGVA